MARKSQGQQPEQSDTGADEVADLRRQLEEARGRAASTESALRDERSARQRAEMAQMGEAERRLVAEQDSCESLLSSLSDQANNIEARIAALADEPGHGADIAKLNREMSRVEAKILQEEQRKDYLAAQREQAKRQPAPQNANERKLANGVPTANFSPTTRAWLDKHPQAFEDSAYCKRVIAHALAAVDLEGIAVDTPEYFSYIEDKMGERQQPMTRQSAPQEDGDDYLTVDSPYSQQTPTPESEGGAEVDYAPRQPQSRAAGPGSIAAAAPPSRSIPGGRQPTGNGRVPALSPEEREMADNLYNVMPNPADRYKKYAQNKAWQKTRAPQHFNGLVN